MWTLLIKYLFHEIFLFSADFKLDSNKTNEPVPDAVSVSVKLRTPERPCSETFSLLKDTRFRVWCLNFYFMQDKDKHHISFFICPAPRCEWQRNTRICSPGFRLRWCLMTETSASSTDTQVSMSRLSLNISKASPFHFYTFIRSVFSLSITAWIRRRWSENSLVFVDEAFVVGVEHFDARCRHRPVSATAEIKIRVYLQGETPQSDGHQQDSVLYSRRCTEVYNCITKSYLNIYNYIIVDTQ